MRFATALVTILMMLSGITASAGTVLGISETLKVGGRPLYALIFGEYSTSYSNAPGFMIGVQGGPLARVDDKLSLYPEFGWGLYHIAHKSESGRRLLVFPFTVSLVIDVKALNFYTKAGVFALKPYVGLGLYLVDYRSDRKSAVAGDFGYQAGIGLEYTHEKMKNAYVEMRINHMLATNFKQILPILDFSVGAGYAFEISRKAP